jgi:Protein of unknown function (DUF4231)
VPPKPAAERTPERSQTEWLLKISGEIADQELKIQETRTIQRLLFAWFVPGNLLVATAITAIAVFVVEFETVQGRTGYRWFFGVGVALSVGLSGVMWFACRQQVRAEKVELTKLRERRRMYLAQGLGDQVGARRRYRDEISSFIEEYRADANRNRRTANNLQSTIIVGSLITTSATSAIGQAPWIRWTAMLVSILVAAAAGIAGFFKFRERAMNQRQTADAIEHEYNAADLGIKNYRDMDPERALAQLAEHVERLREEQRKREQQLEQPAEVRHDSSQVRYAQ